MAHEIKYVNNVFLPDHHLVITHDISDVESVYVVPKQWFKDNNVQADSFSTWYEEAADPEGDPADYTPEQHEYRRLWEELQQFPELHVYDVLLY